MYSSITLDNIPMLEVYHDGDSVILASIQKVESGSCPFPIGQKIGLVLKDAAAFGSAGFEGKKFRITLTKFRDDDNYESWDCIASAL